MNYKYLKGLNDTFGYKNILKVDFNPKKACNFDCIYCPVGRTDKWTINRTKFYSVEEIFSEIEHFLIHNYDIQGVLLTGSGEPSLFSEFGLLAQKIRENYPNLIIMAYTNISLLYRLDVQEDFKKCHVLGCNLNGVFGEEFRRISRPMEEVNLAAALEGLNQFSKQFKGQLLIDTKFVNGFNDTERNVKGLIDYLGKINPNGYVVIGRKHNGQALTSEFIEYLKKEMTDLPFPVTFNL